jgi:UDP-glucose 4-epimerase
LIIKPDRLFGDVFANTSPKVLVTGGAGFIGTHVLAALSEAGIPAIPLDNFCNSAPQAVARVRSFSASVAEAAQIDIRDRQAIARFLATTEVTGVIHLAGLKSVGESVDSPLAYYDNNVSGTIVLLEELARANVRNFVFSSSATVYDPEGARPFVETSPLKPANPYGRTKLMIEEILDDLAAADPRWRIAKLRYFNPIGAHASGQIGEDPRGIPNNLMPYLCRVAAGRAEKLRIFGADYPTPDGTGIRDYVHVMDLAEGHIAALAALQASPAGTRLTVNLGTGRGVSVKELVETFERVNGVPVAREIVARRPGDVAVSYADCALAREQLGWAARRTLEEMCRDAWRWQSRNLMGYKEPAPGVPAST